MTLAIIESDTLFDKALPPDTGIVAPLAPEIVHPYPSLEGEVKKITKALENWTPGKTPDPKQRVWNLLFVAGVFDIDQLAVEPWVPWIVFDRLKREIPKERLIKILYWIACNPDNSPPLSQEDLRALDLPGLPDDLPETRHRIALYAIKLLGRLLGKIR